MGRNRKAIVHKRSRGQTMVEYALLLPLILLLVMGIFAFALIFNVQITLANAVAAGARAGSVVDYGDYPVKDNQNTEIYNAVVANMSWLGKSKVQSITIYQPTSTGGVSTIKDTLNPATGALVSDNFNNELRQSNTSIGVQIVYNVDIWMPFVNVITGPNLPLTVRESRRIE